MEKHGFRASPPDPANGGRVHCLTCLEPSEHELHRHSFKDLGGLAAGHCVTCNEVEESGFHRPELYPKSEIPHDLVEIPKTVAISLRKAGGRVFAHAFDPFEIEYFDPNGRFEWAVQGFRFQGVRFYKVNTE